jgi:hypothetical protein
MSGDPRTEATLGQATAKVVELRDLLQEWLEWWEVADQAPAKMPNALHIRTAVALARRKGTK